METEHIIIATVIVFVGVVYYNKTKKKQKEQKMQQKSKKINQILNREYGSNEVKGEEVLALFPSGYQISSWLLKSIKSDYDTIFDYLLREIQDVIEEWEKGKTSDVCIDESIEVTSFDSMKKFLEENCRECLDEIVNQSFTYREFKQKIIDEYQQKKSEIHIKEQKGIEKIFGDMEEYREIYFTAILPQIRDVLQE